ncbi:unnamed protein product, partial [Brenthis ino]
MLHLRPFKDLYLVHRKPYDGLKMAKNTDILVGAGDGPLWAGSSFIPFLYYKLLFGHFYRLPPRSAAAAAARALSYID